MMKKFLTSLLIIFLVNGTYASFNFIKPNLNSDAYSESAGVSQQNSEQEKRSADQKGTKLAPRDSLEKLKAQLRELNQRLAEYKQFQQKSENKIDALSNIIENSNLVIDSLRQSIEKEEAKKSKMMAKDTMDVEHCYKMALQLFRQEKYQKALPKFKKLMENFPDHELTGNFIYWLGESYFGMQKYQKALEYFDQVERYNDSPKKDDALLMAGRSLAKMGEIEQAKLKFNELIDIYPDSEYIKRARQYLDQF
ncbi:MAG TPA: tol-pal system protein YbgF [bacterium]|nr:tol-pal system protein YbgF [bacterium]